MSSSNGQSSTRVHTRALSRLQQIHQEISAGRYPTVRALAELLERSDRTIKRDLRCLRDQLGAPLHYDHARRGWRYTEPGWALPPQQFNEGELLAFFTAAEVLRATGHQPEAVLLRAALAKLAAFLPAEVNVNLATLGEALTFQPIPHVTVNPNILQALARAAAERRTVSFDYHSQHRNAPTHREADILLLHNFAGDWYAIAYDHFRREVRDFHAGRIKHITQSSKYFDTPPGWNADAYLRRGFYMMRGGRITTVKIVFDSYQARWMKERIAFHPDEQREDLDDGGLRLTFRVGHEGLDAVARFCLAYAGHCRAERPAALRKLIRERLTKALEDHRED